MLVLNCYGKINRICISKKIGMYLSNLPDSVENNWKSALKELNNLGLIEPSVRHG